MMGAGIAGYRFLKFFDFRPENEVLACQDLLDRFVNGLGERPILIAQIEQRHAHGAANDGSFAPSINRNFRRLTER